MHRLMCHLELIRFPGRLAERVRSGRPKDGKEACSAVYEYIELFYNRKSERRMVPREERTEARDS